MKNSNKTDSNWLEASMQEADRFDTVDRLILRTCREEPIEKAKPYSWRDLLDTAIFLTCRSDLIPVIGPTKGAWAVEVEIAQDVAGLQCGDAYTWIITEKHALTRLQKMGHLNGTCLMVVYEQGDSGSKRLEVYREAKGRALLNKRQEEE